MGLFSYKKGCFRIISPVDDTPVESLSGRLKETEFAELAGDKEFFEDAKRSLAREVVRNDPKKQATA
jgi:hypothetical protein